MIQDMRRQGKKAWRGEAEPEHAAVELNVIEQFVQQAPFVAFVPMLSRWHTITARLAGWRLESSRNRRAFLVGALAAFWKFLGSVKSIFKGATRRGPFFQRKKFSAEILLCCLITGTAEAQTSVNLAWDASRSGTVMGYRLYEGTQSGHYGQMIDAGNALSATIPNLAAGTTYYFVATVYDSNGSESLPSNEVSFPVSNGCSIRIRQPISHGTIPTRWRSALSFRVP